MKEGISVRWLNGQNFHYLLKVFLRSVFEVVFFFYVLISCHLLVFIIDYLFYELVVFILFFFKGSTVGTFSILGRRLEYLCNLISHTNREHSDGTVGLKNSKLGTYIN